MSSFILELLVLLAWRFLEVGSKVIGQGSQQLDRLGQFVEVGLHCGKLVVGCCGLRLLILEALALSVQSDFSVVSMVLEIADLHEEVVQVDELVVLGCLVDLTHFWEVRVVISYPFEALISTLVLDSPSLVRRRFGSSPLPLGWQWTFEGVVGLLGSLLATILVVRVALIATVATGTT